MQTMTRTRFHKPDLVLPAWAGTKFPKRGMELVDLRALGIMPGVAGGDRGYNAEGDIVTETADGVDINALWRDYQDMLREFNAQRNDLFNFLTWRTTASREDIVGAGQQTDFEEASEFGEPVGVRPGPPPYTSLGYTLKWYDLAARFTWQFLANSPAQQVDTIADMAAEADNRLMFNMVLRTVFNTNRRVNREDQTVYPFYAGTAGDQPPTVGTTTFADQHNHFVTSGGATITPQNLEAMQELLREHGYKRSNGYTLVLMINDASEEEGVIRNFRSMANGTGEADATHGTYDFVPAQGTPSILLPTDVRLEDNGVTRPPASLRGMEVVGAYAEWTIVKNEYIPAGYVFGFATGGSENINNPVAIREHANAGLRGLRLVKGRTPDYPLIDSFYNRGFGTGIRHRGAGAVMQITANANYAVPPVYAW